MKIDKKYLKQIINEEIQKMASEGELDEGIMDLLSGKKTDKEFTSKIDKKFSELMNTIKETLNYFNKYDPQNKDFKSSLANLYKRLGDVYRNEVLPSLNAAQKQNPPVSEE